MQKITFPKHDDYTDDKCLNILRKLMNEYITDYFPFPYLTIPYDMDGLNRSRILLLVYFKVMNLR